MIPAIQLSGMVFQELGEDWSDKTACHPVNIEAPRKEVHHLGL